MHSRMLVILALLLGLGNAEAGSLRVSPIILDIAAPGQTSALTLRNEDSRPLNAQIRVMRWTQDKNGERLEPTMDVVASPPMATLTPDKDYTVRIVRVSKKPVTGEESYRILIDEIPSPESKAANTITFVLRYSVPVFFSASRGRLPATDWSALTKDGALTLKARNTSSRRLRLANLKITKADGKIVLQRAGLFGYVLAGSAMQWTLPLEPGAELERTTIKLAAESETRPIYATVAVQPGP